MVKHCTKCKKEKQLCEFYELKKGSGRYAAECKSCNIKRRQKYKAEHLDAENKRLKTWRKNNKHLIAGYYSKYRENNKHVLARIEAERRSKKLKATPKWYDKKEVEYIYNLAKEKGFVVDHIVPLKSELVCGLNVQDNLRCIPQKLNAHKGNRYWPDMPKEVVG